MGFKIITGKRNEQDNMRDLRKEDRYSEVLPPKEKDDVLTPEKRMHKARAKKEGLNKFFCEPETPEQEQVYNKFLDAGGEIFDLWSKGGSHGYGERLEYEGIQIFGIIVLNPNQKDNCIVVLPSTDTKLDFIEHNHRVDIHTDDEGKTLRIAHIENSDGKEIYDIINLLLENKERFLNSSVPERHYVTAKTVMRRFMLTKLLDYYKIQSRDLIDEYADGKLGEETKDQGYKALDRLINKANNEDGRSEIGDNPLFSRKTFLDAYNKKLPKYGEMEDK